MKFGNRNFLEPSGPLQTCNGTADFTNGLGTLTEISLEVLIHLQNIVFSVDDTRNGLTDVTKRTLGRKYNRFAMNGKIQECKYREELKLSTRLICSHILKRTSQI